MTTTQIATINRAIEVIADNAARRYAAGATLADAKAGAIAEFSARWPKLGAVAARVMG